MLTARLEDAGEALELLKTAGCLPDGPSAESRPATRDAARIVSRYVRRTLEEKCFERAVAS